MHRQNSHYLFNQKINKSGINVSNNSPSISSTIEDQIARVFLVIGTMHVICHSVRIFLSIHEMLTLKLLTMCPHIGKSGIPFYVMVANEISQFLLVVSASSNILIYIMMSARLRDIFKKWIMPEKKKMTTENEVDAISLEEQNQKTPPEDEENTEE